MSECQWILTKLGMCIDIMEIWFGIANGKKILQFLTELSARGMSDCLFLDNNLSKYQWIFTKLGMCIDIVEIQFEIANVQISSIFDKVICPQPNHIFVLGQ